MKRFLMILLLCLCVAGCIFAGYKLYTVLSDYREARLAYEGLAETYTRANPTPQAPASAEEEEPEETEPLPVPPISVDFDDLLERNTDVIGWLYCEAVGINYPVVQAGDNDYYLHRALDGSYSSGGTIFADCGNSGDFSDGNTIVYGHHMKDGSMFSQLEKYAGQSFYDENPVMWLLTPWGNYQIELFAGYVTAADSYVYTIYEDSGGGLMDYAGTARENSDFSSDVVPEEGDRLVVLSTCDYTFQNARYVVHGILRPCQ